MVSFVQRDGNAVKRISKVMKNIMQIHAVLEHGDESIRVIITII